MILTTFTLAIAIGVSGPPLLPSGAILDGFARRGATFERLEGLGAQSAMACAAMCDRRDLCEAWTYRQGWAGQPARCDLHSIASTPGLEPGAVTGLSPALAHRIETAADRAPNRREQKAIDEADGVLRDDTKDLGPNLEFAGADNKKP